MGGFEDVVPELPRGVEEELPSSSSVNASKVRLADVVLPPGQQKPVGRTLVQRQSLTCLPNSVV